jgi:hypothetical protein
MKNAQNDAREPIQDGEGVEPEFDFPPGLSKPALRALHAAGYTRLDQLAAVTETDLHNLHGMGPKGIRLLRAALQSRGKSFATTKYS